MSTASGSAAPKEKESKGFTDDQKRRMAELIKETQEPSPLEALAPVHVVDEVAQKVLSGIPLRLISLDTGTFSSTADLLRSFKRSPEYQGLLTLPFDDLSEKAEEVARKYLAYVMLSHVWGEDEPLYGQVKLIANILEMSPSCAGTLKLRNFCRIAKQQGFRWCWSDTCCIDKTSSAELQESINSMFTWYRNSTLTIAFLLDVLRSTPDALKQSRWFTRGWTLQELLAPTAIQFYLGDWTPFIVSCQAGVAAASPNHKLVPEFVQLLESILGIDKACLVDFTPGLEDVRERLRWMATRKTTKIEDMAYCLLGILDLRLPVLYGEGERAFIRLQDEIMKNTEDTCIFDWVGRPSNLNSFLARSPSCFRQPCWRPSAYQTTAKVPVLEAVSEFTHKISASLLQVAESLLDEPPLGHFIANGRMNLRMFVYQVKSIELVATTEVPLSTGRKERLFMYNSKAHGLESVTVVTTYEFVDLSRAARALSLGRVWDNSLRVIRTSIGRKKEDSSGDDAESICDDYNPWSIKRDDYTAELGKRMCEPFVAQLLFVHPDGQFRRIHTEERIVAQPYVAELLELRTPRTLIVH